MHDDLNPAAHGAAEVPAEPIEPGAAGEVIKRARFGIGARATILMGLTIGVVSAMTAGTAVLSHSVSAP
jgi:hypothetical protein